MKLGLPPIMIPARNKFKDYYPALDAYDRRNDLVPLEDYLELLLLEALNKYIMVINGAKLIPVVEWAKNNSTSSAAILNKAKRQTIPAFRQRGQWMIEKGFVDTDGVEVGR